MFYVGNEEIARFLLQNGAGLSSYTLMDYPAFSRLLVEQRLVEEADTHTEPAGEKVTEGRCVCICVCVCVSGMALTSPSALLWLPNPMASSVAASSILKRSDRRRGGWELCVRVRANLNLERSGDNGGSSNLSYSPSIPQSLSLSLALSLSRYCTCFNLSSIGLEMSLWSFRL